MHDVFRYIPAFVLCVFILSEVNAQSEPNSKNISSFVEYGASIHSGDNIPLWQVSNQHGLSSIHNNTYLRGGIVYSNNIKQWRLESGLDIAVASGFTSKFVIHQAYADVRYKWFGLFVGSKEIDSPLLNQQLSSGGLTWSGNARPIPQVCIGMPEYVYILPRIALKAELSYGWFTDNNYQKNTVGTDFWYTKNIKYHHKSGFLRIGKPQGKWQLYLGLSLDVQFGGQIIDGTDRVDLGNSIKDYLKVFIPSSGDDSSPAGEQVAYQGNFMGSEHIRMTYRNDDHSLSAYLENYYDDFSGIGKLNSFDGLWGIEYKTSRKQAISGFVLEYYQTTHQSGPMHGLDESVVEKTGGADDYYNNDWYPGWVHWGMTMANPLIASPIYNKDGDMTFKFNRVKAVHLGLNGHISNEWTYTAKMSYNKTFGTPFKPTSHILENFATFASVEYSPLKCKGWRFNLSVALDMGEIYGDNLGCQLRIHKTF